jgi:transposase
MLESLKQWLEETLVKLSKKSDTAVAVRYALGRWKALLRYCDDGRLEIDNNAAERALRAVGRQKELLVRGIGSRWRERRSDLQPDRNSQTKWDRS